MRFSGLSSVCFWFKRDVGWCEALGNMREVTTVSRLIEHFSFKIIRSVRVAPLKV